MRKRLIKVLLLVQIANEAHKPSFWRENKLLSAACSLEQNQFDRRTELN